LSALYVIPRGSRCRENGRTKSLVHATPNYEIPWKKRTTFPAKGEQKENKWDRVNGGKETKGKNGWVYGKKEREDGICDE